MDKALLNIPNALSLYRLLSFPFLIWFILTNQQQYFAILLCINLITDILDGWIARAFKLQTAFGARLDSLADFGTYIAAFWGVWEFKLEEFGELSWMLWVFIGSIVLYMLVSLMKFGKAPSLHLYSTKIGGYLQGGFFFFLFALGFYKWFFILAMIWGYLSAIEEVIILLILPELKSNVKGLYWILKDKNRTNF